ncbi:hypothetical protein GCK72_024218 [Caenorhabditis remanei]|uniref:CRE-RAB-37 protein n=2 Tax=Caenorhabditis remanei TaxID=31234 RepID=E3LEL5_CAERE|nr:hypothetical protein GCK72_024218 [Caenorhabditis remanei]EFO82556.1 CRE-RAB-37 protein [Caenorhabditis remanei]KAF1747752.1 hypothetical protein GCK72_024218 [Caenorhabditis remanei]
MPNQTDEHSVKSKHRSEMLDLEVSDKITIKVMLLGDSCTGKTCLLIRYKDGAFLNNNFISTVGIDYRNKLVTMGDKKVKLQIWDTAGQERFRSVTTSYYRDADALLLVYDIANRASFENCRNWLSQIKEFGKEAVQVTLVGNKCDLPRAVPTDEGKRLAEAYAIPFMETSAKTGHNVDRAFLGLAERMIKMKYGFVPGGEMADTISINEPKTAELSRCCNFN